LHIPSNCWVAWEQKSKKGLSVMKREFIISCKHHSEVLERISSQEWVGLKQIIAQIDSRFGIQGGTLTIEVGNALRDAKHVPHHLHARYDVGNSDISVDESPSLEDLMQKLKILTVFEEMRIMKEEGLENEKIIEGLSKEKRELVCDLTD
jgi:hypothetical protein